MFSFKVNNLQLSKHPKHLIMFLDSAWTRHVSEIVVKQNLSTATSKMIALQDWAIRPSITGQTSLILTNLSIILLQNK